VRVASLEDKAEAYSSRLTVYNEPVDMTCKIVNLKRKWKTNWHLEYNEWLEFDVCLRNNGTQPAEIETVSIIIVKEPEGYVVYREEIGFGIISQLLWYQTPEPLKYAVQNNDVETEAGAYRVEITVDPLNRLGEDPAMREDNTTIRRFILKERGDRF